LNPTWFRFKRACQQNLYDPLKQRWDQSRLLKASPGFAPLLQAYRAIYPDSAHANLVSWLERKDTFRHEQEGLTYGETPFSTWLTLLKLMRPQAGESFAELGCGTGILSLYLAYRFGNRVTGVDTIERFVQNASQLAHDFELPADFRCLSVLDLDLRPFRLLYCVATCFSEETRNALAEKLAECEVGTRIWVVTHEFESPKLKVEASYRLHFAWGWDRVYLVERV
jgi:SAM-dependent methyltransferase